MYGRAFRYHRNSGSWTIGQSIGTSELPILAMSKSFCLLIYLDEQIFGCVFRPFATGRNGGTPNTGMVRLFEFLQDHPYPSGNPIQLSLSATRQDRFNLTGERKMELRITALEFRFQLMRSNSSCSLILGRSPELGIRTGPGKLGDRQSK